MARQELRSHVSSSTNATPSKVGSNTNAARTWQELGPDVSRGRKATATKVGSNTVARTTWLRPRRSRAKTTDTGS